MATLPYISTDHWVRLLVLGFQLMLCSNHDPKIYLFDPGAQNRNGLIGALFSAIGRGHTNYSLRSEDV